MPSIAESSAPVEPLLGGRYTLLDELGRGAMGVVHRAVDRLASDTVTIKLASVGGGAEGSGSASDVLVSLAHEFEVLASLRHPNVIRVFDYGFDPARGPYFVMEHRPHAETLLPAAARARREEKIALLMDVLRGLAYLHRRGIVHRDVKPENVLVDGGRARLVDFGLSLTLDQTAEDLAGTAPYLAPEVLLGGAPSAASDLWATGVIAVELLAGRHPFDGSSMLSNVLHREPDLAGLDDRIAPVIARLLAKDPKKRFASALAAAEALSAATPEPAPIETVETRESFLQASRFVGRRSELDELTAAFGALGSGGGSTWLIGGESGVGKSRLAHEAAIRALVSGVRVLRGHAVSDAASPYDVWRPVLRGIALTAGPTDAEAAVLRAVVPDIDALLRRQVGAAPAAEEAAAQTRLLMTIEGLLARERTPTLVILEDLQWAGSESLRLLTWLARALDRAPFVVLGTYRDDEAPRLPSLVEPARVLRLARLPRHAVGELARAIIGPSGDDDALLDRLVAETEGNPFFLVETLRAIANRVGALGAVGAQHLHAAVPAEGVRKILEQRLARPSATTRELLRVAAISGRRLDLAVLARAAGIDDIDPHLRSAAEYAIVEATADTWEFSHDKLREALQREIVGAERAGYHVRVAQAIEAVHGEHADHLAALAHHWELAEDEARSMRYAELAGARALDGGAFPEAMGLLERARAYAERRAERERAALLFRIDAHLTTTCYQLGDLERARRFGEMALAHVGDPIPERPIGKAVACAREAATRVVASFRPAAPSRLAPEDLARYARVLIVLSECFMFAMESQSFAIAALRLTNRTAPAGPSAPLARGFLDLGMLAMTTPFKRTATRWVERATTMSREHGAGNDHAFVLSRAGVLAITTARWTEAEERIRTAMVAATNHGDRRLLDECSLLLAVVAFYRGRYRASVERYTATREQARRGGTHQVARWSATGCADSAARQGRFAEALDTYDRTLGTPGLSASERVWAHGMRALSRLRTGDRAGARADAHASLALLDRSPPVGYWMAHGVHATSVVLIELSPEGAFDAAAARSVGHATVLGGVAGLARPAAALLQGELLRRAGRTGAARRLLARAWRLGDQLDMAYERASASFALASCEPEEDEREALLARARAELSGLAAEAGGPIAAGGQALGFASAR